MLSYSEIINRNSHLEAENARLLKEIGFVNSAINKIPAMIGYWDKHLINRFSNKAYTDWFGVSAENLYGKHIKELLGENIYTLNLPYIEAVLNGTPQQFEREIPFPEGAGTRFSLAEYIPNFVNDQVEGFFVQVTDITAIKQTEILLRQSQERYKLVVQDQTELISRLAADGTYIFANEAFLRFFGKNEEELIGFKWMPLVHEDDLSRVSAEISTLSPTNPMVVIENRVYSFSGNIHWMQFNNRGKFNESGELIEIQSVGRDVTEFKKANQALKLASTVYQSTSEGIFVTDADKLILSVNPGFTRITGFSSEEVLGFKSNLLELDNYEDEFYLSMWKAIADNGTWHGQVWCKHKNGETLPYLMTISSVFNTSGGVTNYVGIFSDNSEAIKFEQQRLIAEKRDRETLIREVHHRIKNNLHGVIGLLNNMIDQYPNLASPIQNAISKVKSIAIIYGLKGDNLSNNISLIDLLNTIIESDQTLFDSKISLRASEDCQSISIIEPEAVPAALILNELILNSIKHATNRNQIDIECFKDTIASRIVIKIKNIAQLSINSSTNQPKFGTGLQLVKSLMPKQGFELAWEQKEDWVITTINLSSPILSICTN